MKELIEEIHEEFAGRFYELGQYCSLKDTVTLNYPIGKIILEYDYNRIEITSKEYSI